MNQVVNPTQQVTSRRLRFLVGAGLLLVFLVVLQGLVFRGEYISSQTAQRVFVMEQDFTKVRKIMVRTNAAKEIVTMGGGSEFVSQRWSDAGIDAAGDNVGEALLQTVLSSDPDWKIQLSGTLQVRTLDEYIGQQVVTLEQDVEILPDQIESQVTLEKGSERLLDYTMLTRLSRAEYQTRVELELTQTIKTEAPWFAHGIADRRVRASAASALENQESAMRQLIEENADKAGLFPLR